MAAVSVYAFVTTPQSQVPNMQEFLQLQHSSATYIRLLFNS
jgi:hypothetical protein